MHQARRRTRRRSVAAAAGPRRAALAAAVRGVAGARDTARGRSAPMDLRATQTRRDERGGPRPRRHTTRPARSSDTVLTQHRTARGGPWHAVADDETSKYERTVR